MYKELSELKDKKILVVGLGKTGVSLAQFLVQYGAQVTVTDHKSKPELSTQLELLGDLPIRFELGGHSPKTFIAQDLVILSPGVPSNLKIFDYARSQGIKITGEFEFSANFIKEPIIGITGTNGKTTVAKLAQAILTESGIKTWLGGSNEHPMVEYLRQPEKAAVVIAEISSFMLEHVDQFNPGHIVFTNLAENHLDRYRSLEEYVNAKRKIFKNTSSTTLSILNADDSAVVELAFDPAVLRARIFYYSRNAKFEDQILRKIGGAFYINNEIRVRTGPETEVFDVKNMKMRGKHSIENMMAAILATREFNPTKEAVQKVIETFPGLPHRIEYVRKVGGVQFYNDSKATNVHAVLRALDTFDENVILIAGGKDTNINFEPLRNAVRKKVKTLILVGESKERMNRDLGDFSETFLIGTFEEAVLIAYQKSRIGDIVLLSPGCSSFDLFDSYKERGDYFKEIVRKFGK